MTIPPPIRPDFDSHNYLHDLLADLAVKADLAGGIVILTADDLRRLSQTKTDPGE